jgi:hypothetical protein
MLKILLPMFHSGHINDYARHVNGGRLRIFSPDKSNKPLSQLKVFIAAK